MGHTGVSGLCVQLQGSGLCTIGRFFDGLKISCLKNFDPELTQAVTLVYLPLPVKVLLINSPVTADQSETAKMSEKYFISQKERTAIPVMVPGCGRMQRARAFEVQLAT